MTSEKKTKFKFQTADVILCILFMISVILIIWGIQIYRMTLIPLKYLFTIAAFGTMIAFGIILFSHHPSYKMFYTFFVSIMIGGGISYFSFLYLNDRFKEKEVLTEDFKISETGNFAKRRRSSCRQPYAIINFNEIEKKLMFYCEYEKSIKTFSKVRLEYSKGLFGFEVISSKQLIK